MEAVGSSETFSLVYQPAVLYSPEVHSIHIHYFKERNNFYTGRFIMFSGIRKIYYRKTVGQVFTKLVQIEGKTQFFFPSKLLFIVVHISATRRCGFM